MKRDRQDLIRNTVIWIAVVIWLVWGFFIQAPPEDAYNDAFRRVFTLILAIVIPLISGVIAFSWLVALRRR